ncbi:hypothetical protein V6N13_073041 [Hibiscus sabdariffa]
MSSLCLGLQAWLHKRAFTLLDYRTWASNGKQTEVCIAHNQGLTPLLSMPDFPSLKEVTVLDPPSMTTTAVNQHCNGIHNAAVANQHGSGTHNDDGDSATTNNKQHRTHLWTYPTLTMVEWQRNIDARIRLEKQKVLPNNDQKRWANGKVGFAR